MNRDNENNKIIDESIVAVDKPINEQKNVNETILIDEYKNTSEQNSSFKKTNKKSKIKTAIVSFAALAMLCVVGTSTIVNTEMTAEINEIEYVDGDIKYDIYTDNIESDNQLILEVDYNSQKKEFVLFDGYDFIIQNNPSVSLTIIDIDTNIKETLNLEEIVDIDKYIKNMPNNKIVEFIVYDVKTGEYLYNYTVKNQGKSFRVQGTIVLGTSIIESKLETDNVFEIPVVLKGNIGLVEKEFANDVIEIKKLISEFRNVTWHCNCNVDGYLYYTLDFSDDYSRFSEFSVSIMDWNEYEKQCELNGDLHSEQKVYVADLVGSTVTLFVRYIDNNEEVELVFDIEI